MAMRCSWERTRQPELHFQLHLQPWKCLPGFSRPPPSLWPPTHLPLAKQLSAGKEARCPGGARQLGPRCSWTAVFLIRR